MKQFFKSKESQEKRRLKAKVYNRKQTLANRERIRRLTSAARAELNERSELALRLSIEAPIELARLRLKKLSETEEINSETIDDISSRFASRLMTELSKDGK